MSNDQQFSLITSYRHNFEIISSSFCQQYGKFNQTSRDESLELLFIIQAFRQRYIYIPIYAKPFTENSTFVN